MKQKLKRSLTSLLPVSPDRRGNCNDCGECCRLPNRCPFLRTRSDGGGSHCAIYRIRPLNCRKYPRTADELITPERCGYYFEADISLPHDSPATEIEGV
ncbi:MAG TPA: hypothetical protein ENK05_13445 [Gammaproteobacteria bacterium]|nr:hypothetical protein [Gammaproteobacteria bacterium]